MIEINRCQTHNDPLQLECFQWRSGYRREDFGELPDWLNRKEYCLHETGGNLHIYLPINGSGRGRTMVAQPGDFIMNAPDGQPMMIREGVFRCMFRFVSMRPANLMAEQDAIESFVIVASQNA
jgi:hypothetical protein